MRLLRLLALGISIASVATLSGCAGETDEETAAGDEALSGRVLQPSECPVKAPNSSKVPGVFDAKLSGCFIARGNESGAAMIDRAAAIIANPAEIGAATHHDGSKMFTSFKPSAPQ